MVWEVVTGSLTHNVCIHFFFLKITNEIITRMHSSIDKAK